MLRDGDSEDGDSTGGDSTGGVDAGAARVVGSGGRRRRGEELHDAICRATIDELSEHGYAGLTMDTVAARAHTGKATLYRRWPSKVELVADALLHTVPVFEPPPDTGRLRDELLTLMETVSNHLTGPMGAAARGLMAEVARSPELAEILRGQITDPVVAPTLEVLRRAVVRGEAPAAALIPRVAGVGPELLRQHFLMYGAPVPREVLEEIVDQIVLPLLRGIE